MNHSIITSDRYIAIKTAGNIARNNVVRILTKDEAGTGELIVPCKFHPVNKRLESVALNCSTVPAMFEKSSKLEAKLKAAGLDYEWLTLEQSRELTAA